MTGRSEAAAHLVRGSPALSLPAARRTTCSPTWREQALKGLCSQRPQQLRVRSLRETASHINVDHVERILRGLEPTQPAGRAARRRRTSRCPFRKDTQLFKRTQGFSRKHIDRRHFYVRECVENMQLWVPFVKTVDNLADFFTKPLTSKNFYRMRDILMNVPSHASDTESLAEKLVNAEDKYTAAVIQAEH